MQGLAEGLHFAKCAGLDIEKLIATISKGAAQSWQMENRYKTMVEGKFEFGFAVDWMRKDLGICFAEARRNGATLPVTALVDQFYAEVQKMGGRRWDTSSLIARWNAERRRPNSPVHSGVPAIIRRRSSIAFLARTNAGFHRWSKHALKDFGRN